MRYQWLLAVCLAAALAGCATPGYDLYLVRHAEKLPNTDDPGLTEAGLARAERLAAWLENRELRAVWSSDYRRTRETAEPLTRRLGQEVELYDPRRLDDIAATLQERGESALVVGHSNTTPDLARLLCDCEVDDIADDEFDRLIRVRVKNGQRLLEEIGQISLP